jgi:CBS domain-containing protein
MGVLPTVRMHMDKRVHTLRPETDIRDAVKMLVRHRITGAPVVDENRKVVGMLTEKDCLKLIAKGVDGDAVQGEVASFMTREVTTIPPDVDVYYTAGLFLSHHFRRLPVVEDGRLVGAITRFDILRIVGTNLR